MFECSSSVGDVFGRPCAPSCWLTLYRWCRYVRCRRPSSSDVWCRFISSLVAFLWLPWRLVIDTCPLVPSILRRRFSRISSFVFRRSSIFHQLVNYSSTLTARQLLFGISPSPLALQRLRRLAPLVIAPAVISSGWLPAAGASLHFLGSARVVVSDRADTLLSM